MSSAATIDLRFPVGGLLAVNGAILAVFGYATRDSATLYAQSGNLNINLLWGLVMLAAGMLFLVLALLAGRDPPPATRNASEMASGAGADPR